MSDEIYAEVGRRIREHRNARTLSLEDLAERAGITASFLGQIERLERKLSLKTLGTIATALGLSPATLLSDGSSEGRRARDWERRLIGVLESLPERSRALVLETAHFVASRLRRR